MSEIEFHELLTTLGPVGVAIIAGYLLAKSDRVLDFILVLLGKKKPANGQVSHAEFVRWEERNEAEHQQMEKTIGELTSKVAVLGEKIDTLNSLVRKIIESKPVI